MQGILIKEKFKKILLLLINKIFWMKGRPLADKDFSEKQLIYFKLVEPFIIYEFTFCYVCKYYVDAVI